jgi:hypothetical protein
MKRVFLILLALLVASQAVFAAPKPPRPTAGIGVLLVRPFPATHTLAETMVTVFQAPGIGRLQELPAGKVQLLAPVFGTSDTEIPVAVTDRNGEWLFAVYDDAGREGWVRQERPWDFVPWEVYLKGRTANLLPGLRKQLYQLLREPTDNAVAAMPLTTADTFRLVAIDGDWALVLVGQERTGWLRWRDRDNRFMLAVGASTGQKR